MSIEEIMAILPELDRLTPLDLFNSYATAINKKYGGYLTAKITGDNYGLVLAIVDGEERYQLIECVSNDIKTIFPMEMMNWFETANSNISSIESLEEKMMSFFKDPDTHDLIIDLYKKSVRHMSHGN